MPSKFIGILIFVVILWLECNSCMGRPIRDAEHGDEVEVEKKTRFKDHLVTIFYVSSTWSIAIVIRQIYTEIKSGHIIDFAEVCEVVFTGLGLIGQLLFHLYEHPALKWMAKYLFKAELISAAMMALLKYFDNKPSPGEIARMQKLINLIPWWRICLVTIPLIFGLFWEKAVFIPVCLISFVAATKNMKPCFKWAYFKELLKYILKTYASFCLMVVMLFEFNPSLSHDGIIAIIHAVELIRGIIIAMHYCKLNK